MKTINYGHRPVHVWTNHVEESAEKQLCNLSKLPFVFHKGIAVMPDVHAGIGSTVGSVIPTIKAIIPAAVGVDIGCGMCAVRTTLSARDLPDNLGPLRHEIERSIPTGKYHNREAPPQEQWKHLTDLFEKLPNHQALNSLVSDKTFLQLGTLGGGNHFIELCLDENDSVWLMLHSGSRGIGNQIGRHYITAAKNEMERWHISLDDPDLAYFPEHTQLFAEYITAVSWAQDFAKTNRAIMMDRLCRIMERTFTDFEIHDHIINCHHNYVERENHYGHNIFVTRKGAIRARKGDIGIIPGSMGTRSYIVEGLGNRESYHSCSHGAGRIMSRNEARQRFTVEDLKQQTNGVECRKDQAIVDEIPGAYKDIDEVMENQKDLVRPLHTLRAMLCIKGD